MRALSAEQKEEQLAQWFAADRGQQLLAAEKSALAEVLEGRLCFRLVQLDSGAYTPFWRSEGVGVATMVSLLPHQAACACVRAYAHQLPFQSKSLDVILMHHSLDFSQDAYACLREATRCLSDSGVLVILGFNPGLWSLFKRLPGFCQGPGLARFLSPGRVGDWLQLLEFEPEQSQLIYPKLWHWQGQAGRPPGFWQQQLGRFLPAFNASYLMVARKRTLSRLHKKQAHHYLPMGVVGPRLNRQSNHKVNACDKSS